MRALTAFIAGVSLLSASAVRLEASAPQSDAYNGRTVLVSPIRAELSLEAAPKGTRVSLEPRAYQNLADVQKAVMTSFPISETDRIDLDLERFEVLSDDARIVMGTPEGNVAIPRPDVALFRGTVVGDPDSEVYLAITPDGANGWVRSAGEMNVLSSGPYSMKNAMTITPSVDLPEPTKPWTCGTDNLPLPPIGEVVPHTGLRLTTCFSADIAVETDYEYTQLFGGNTTASSAYVATLFGAINTIYGRDHNITLNVSFLRVWAANNDPYSGSDFLNAFQNEWNANMTHIARSAAHFMSGRTLGGGVAYLNALCFPGWDYGASGNINGWFPTPLAPNDDNWDLIVVAHELGHNFGSHHTHCYSPPIDTCYSGESGCYVGATSLPPGGLGTIMSYCHQQPGGLSNMDLVFHTRVRDRVLAFLQNESPCDLSVPCSTPCPAADVNCDGTPDGLDMGIIKQGANWNQSPPANSRADVNGDGTADGLDMGVIKQGANWNVSFAPCVCP